jgi:thiol peroxidase
MENTMTTITFQGSPIHTIGELPAIGSQAPAFILTRNDLSDITSADCVGKKVVLNIFPSLDTPICASAVKRFNEIAGDHKDVTVLCVSADLPFAQNRFCSTDNLKNVVPVSVFHHTDFGKKYGVQIIDGPLAGLLSRAVIVLDKDGKVVYTEQVQELADEPNYQAALNAIK